MPRQENGYATVTITAILMGLSIIAVAILNHASAASQKGQKFELRVQLDAALEGALHIAIADLINGELTLNGDRTESTGSALGQSVYISISDEAAKTDINRAAIEMIEQTFGGAIDDAQTRSNYLDAVKAKRSAGTLFQSVSELFSAAGGTGGNNCLREQITVFHSSAVSTAHAGRQVSLDGRILRIRAETRRNDGLNRGVDAIILFTGDRNDPAWVMDWRRYNAPKMETCK